MVPSLKYLAWQRMRQAVNSYVSLSKLAIRISAPSPNRSVRQEGNGEKAVHLFLLYARHTRQSGNLPGGHDEAIA
jgi:hypothetical protein